MLDCKCTQEFNVKVYRSYMYVMCSNQTGILTISGVRKVQYYESERQCSREIEREIEFWSFLYNCFSLNK